MADELSSFTKEFIQEGLTWWLGSSSIRLGGSGVVADQAVQHELTVSAGLQGICIGIGTVIALILTLFAAIKTMIQRKGVHLYQVIQGLIINVLVAGLGIAVIDGLLVISDDLSKEILNIAFAGKAADQIAGIMVAVLVSAAWNPTTTLVLCLIVLLIGVAQLCMIFIRQAALPIQALLLPIAAAGQLGGPQARGWLPRLYTSIFTVIAYKPMAALLIGIGFVELNNGKGFLDWTRGIVTLLLAVFSLPILMQLFAPLGVSMAGATAGGGFLPALMQAAASAAASRGGGEGGQGTTSGTSAVQHAAQMAKTGPAAATPAVAAIQTAKLAKAGLDSAAGLMAGQSPSQSSPGPGGDGAKPGGERGQAPGSDQDGESASSPPPPTVPPVSSPDRPDSRSVSSPQPSAPTSDPAPPGPEHGGERAPAGPVPASAGPEPAGTSTPHLGSRPAPPTAPTSTTPPGAPDPEPVPAGVKAWTRYSSSSRRGPEGAPPPQTWPGSRDEQQ